MTKEQWKPVVGHPHYEVSNKGRIRSIDRLCPRGGGTLRKARGREMSLVPNRKGYLVTCLSGIPRSRQVKVHIEVALAFMGPRPNGMYVCHRDGNKANNKATNLKYASPKENQEDSLHHGTRAMGERSGHAKVKTTDIYAIREACRTGLSQRAVGKAFGITQSNVSRIVNGQTWAIAAPPKPKGGK